MISGYAAVFYNGDESTEYRLSDGRRKTVYERIHRDAFNRAIHNDDVVALFNHSPDNLLGRSKAGTLNLAIDDRGLKYEVTEADHDLYRQVDAMQQRGDLAGSSFGFEVLAEEFRQEGDKLVRELVDVKLYDVGPVTFPAYSATSEPGRSHRVVIEGRTVDPTGYEARAANERSYVQFRLRQLKG